jgi:hypothetical protein
VKYKSASEGRPWQPKEDNGWRRAGNGGGESVSAGWLINQYQWQCQTNEGVKISAAASGNRSESGGIWRRHQAAKNAKIGWHRARAASGAGVGGIGMAAGAWHGDYPGVAGVIWQICRGGSA